MDKIKEIIINNLCETMCDYYFLCQIADREERSDIGRRECDDLNKTVELIKGLHD